MHFYMVVKIHFFAYYKYGHPVYCVVIKITEKQVSTYCALPFLYKCHVINDIALNSIYIYLNIIGILFVENLFVS